MSHIKINSVHVLLSKGYCHNCLYLCDFPYWFSLWLYDSYIYNICTLSENIKFISTSFTNRQKSEPLARFSSLFRNECKLISYSTSTYIVFILQYQKVKKKQLPNCLKITETSVVLIVFNGVICDVSAYDRFFLSLYLDQVPEMIYQVHDLVALKFI